MAQMVGRGGRVTGIEFDPDLAARARANFAAWPNVEILTGDGAAMPFAPADVIYVNAGAAAPARLWLDGLNLGGRLVLPLTTAENFRSETADPAKMASRGAVFLIARHAAGYSAKWISPVAIFPCAGDRDGDAERSLAAALAGGGVLNVARLDRTPHAPAETCWLHGDGWCLAAA